MPAPWHDGRAALIGDAAHATTPHIAYGAGLAVEDGVVLGDCLAAAANRAEALHTFMERRFERCRMVVENSLQICRWQQGLDLDDGDADQAALTNQSWYALATT
jgi:2-polyprenyl-6-methoxyphenol hydroxylase-like FAD-dependent oxidoreductase